MTKYEWERELRNNLKRVPETEVARILDYYNELFADKAEEGLSEKEIVRRFGNPFDVAYKILYDYRGGAAPAPDEFREEPAEISYTAPRAPQEPPYAPYPPPHTSSAAATHEPRYYAPPYAPGAAPEQGERQKYSGGAGWLAARILFFLPYMIVMIVMWSLVVSFAAAGVGSLIGGIGYALLGFTYLASSAGATAVIVGSGIAAFGVGCLMSAGAYAFFKTAVKITQKYFYMGKHKTSNIR